MSMVVLMLFIICYAMSYKGYGWKSCTMLSFVLSYEVVNCIIMFCICVVDSLVSNQIEYLVYHAL